MTTPADVIAALTDTLRTRSSEQIEGFAEEMLVDTRHDPFVWLALVAAASGLPAPPSDLLPAETVGIISLLLSTLESLALARERDALRARVAELEEQVVDLRARYEPLDLGDPTDLDLLGAALGARAKPAHLSRRGARISRRVHEPDE
jgi:hypothetical protein